MQQRNILHHRGSFLSALSLPFQQPATSGNNSSHMLAACLQSAFNRGYTHRFLPVPDGYERYGNLFIKKSDVTIDQIIQWFDMQKQETLVFEYITCKCTTRGFALTRSQLEHL